LLVEELPTPSIIVDLDALEKNIATMARYCRSVKCGLRPHVKAHKSPFIAKKQIDAGALGVCAQTLEEAEAMIFNGVDHLILTNMLVSERSIDRFLNMRQNGDVIVTADNPETAALLGKYANKRKLTVDILVEINVGQNRTGVLPGEPAAKLASEVSRIDGLNFKGLMGYEGFLQLSIPDFEKRKIEDRKALFGIMRSIDAVKKIGLVPEIVTSGGTGTYNIAAEFEGVNEIQPGSYVMMDNAYRKIQTCGSDFENSLYILSTAISTHPDRVVTDVGWKAASIEYQIFGWDGMPHLVDGKATYSPGGDEHGILHYEENTPRPNLGDRLKFIPSHCDTTLNLYSKFYGVRGDRVEVVCPIAKR
jgi:3-hydroxy-D-aspartate aldolase